MKANFAGISQLQTEKQKKLNVFLDQYYKDRKELEEEYQREQKELEEILDQPIKDKR